MRTNIHPDLVAKPEVLEADAILRKCVHCGFCTATCPTYQLLGDELDGPRGRIYLIKNLLEENSIANESAVHLDRCLTCRACETTCPSGVEYGRLLDIGRELIVDKVNRPLREKILSALVRCVIPRSWLLRTLLPIGQFFRPVLPRMVADHIPKKQKDLMQTFGTASLTVPVSGDRIFLLSGCIQAAATPGVVQALTSLLLRMGHQVTVLNEGCCGALDYHLSAHDAGRERMRKVIDQLIDRIDEFDYVVSSATGCGVTISEYAQTLQGDAIYAVSAAKVQSKFKDASQLFDTHPFQGGSRQVAVHTPCSMQHGLKLTGNIENILRNAGFGIVESPDGHLCCGSAGTYSLLQPDISAKLRQGKLRALQLNVPDVIVTANIGCQLQLDNADVPVMHWLELLAQCEV